MKLPHLYEELTDRLWEALHAGSEPSATTLISKGPAPDIIDGLSDMDFRVVLDARGPEDWQRTNDAFYGVFKDFAHEYPDGWRIIEHPAGRNVEPCELEHPAVLDERFEWDVLRTDDASLASPLTAVDAQMQDLYLRKFVAYRHPYNVAIDPPVNVSAANLPRYRLYSICWHYYAPALRCAALAMGEGTVHGKWDAVRWRADAGSETAKDVVRVAEAGFATELDDLAVRCAQDILEVARDLVDADDPWPIIERRAVELQRTHDEWLFHLISTNRLSMSRFRFYIDAPQGYDLEAVVRIDRGHVHNYLAGPLDDQDWVKALMEHADDPDALERGIAFLQDQHHATEVANPREIFKGFCANYAPVWAAMENRYRLTAAMPEGPVGPR